MMHRREDKRRWYYWIVALDQETKKHYLIYGGLNESDARAKGLELLGGVDFEIKKYPTRDLATASSYYRGKRLETTHSLKEASKRIGHGRSLSRLRKKHSNFPFY